MRSKAASRRSAVWRIMLRRSRGAGYDGVLHHGMMAFATFSYLVLRARLRVAKASISKDGPRASGATSADLMVRDAALATASAAPHHEAGGVMRGMAAPELRYSCPLNAD